jgi:hypothetical protein
MCWVGFGVGYCRSVPLAAIKSVEPAPPAVGDSYKIDAGGPYEFTIEGAGNNWTVIKDDLGVLSLHCGLDIIAKRPGFRIVKKAEANK